MNDDDDDDDDDMKVLMRIRKEGRERVNISTGGVLTDRSVIVCRTLRISSRSFGSVYRVESCCVN